MCTTVYSKVLGTSQFSLNLKNKWIRAHVQHLDFPLIVIENFIHVVVYALMNGTTKSIIGNAYVLLAGAFTQLIKEKNLIEVRV